MYTKEQCDACYNHAVKRIKNMAGVEFGEDWDPFTIEIWLKDLKRGYFYEFGQGGKLKSTRIVEGKPADANAIVTMPSDDFVGEHTLEVQLKEKYDSGEMTVNGDVEKLQRFSLFADYEPYYPPGHPKAPK